MGRDYGTPQSMVKTKSKKTARRFRTAGLFVLFSTILFLNNVTPVFDKFDLSYEINIFTWIGLIGIVIYIIYKLAGRDF